MKTDTETFLKREDYLYHAVMTCLTDKATADIRKNNIELKLTVNGIEIPVEKFFKSLEQQHERIIGEDVLKTLNGKLNDTFVGLDQLHREAKQQLEDKVRELFPDIRTEDFS